MPSYGRPGNRRAVSSPESGIPILSGLTEGTTEGPGLRRSFGRAVEGPRPLEASPSGSWFHTGIGRQQLPVSLPPPPQLHTWQTNDVLQANDLNGTFKNLQDQINASLVAGPGNSIHTPTDRTVGLPSLE